MMYAISLGSNDKSGEYLKKAIDGLKKKCEIEKVSPVYETEPFETPCMENFLNACLILKTGMRPAELLDFTQGIERSLGRTSKGDKTCRTIDIDILLAMDTIFFSRDLRIPHPELHRRGFFLVPLSDIAGGWIDPLTGKRIKELVEDLGNTGGIWKTGISLE